MSRKTEDIFISFFRPYTKYAMTGRKETVNALNVTPTPKCFSFSSYCSSSKFETSCYIFTFKKYIIQQIIGKFKLPIFNRSPHCAEAIAHVVQIAPKTGFNGCSCILNSFFFPLTATVPLRDWAQNRADLHDQRRRDLSCEAGSGRLRARWGHIHLGDHHQ